VIGFLTIDALQLVADKIRVCSHHQTSIQFSPKLWIILLNFVNYSTLDLQLYQSPKLSAIEFWKFLFPPLMFLLYLPIPFLTLNKYFGTRFLIFVCLRKKLRNVFSKFELEKLWKTRSEVFIQEQKWKNGVERNMGSGKRKILEFYTDSLSWLLFWTGPRPNASGLAL
jgi:hypothetical protein